MAVLVVGDQTLHVEELSVHPTLILGGLTKVASGFVSCAYSYLSFSRMSPALPDPSTRGISTEISPNDGMYSGNTAHYMGVSHSALRNIQSSLVLVGATEPKRILDLPCGHGRVVRALRAAFPAAEITACDIDRDGVDYCARTFEAIPNYSVADPNEIRLDGPYDLIWCGSLFTHLPLARWDGFLGLFDRLLAPGGVLVFTTHGRRTEAWLRGGKAPGGRSAEDVYGLTPPQIAELLDGISRSGFGYVDYTNQDGYGISASRLPFVIATLQRVTSLRVAACLEHGWDEHQDVIACAKPQEDPRVHDEPPRSTQQPSRGPLQKLLGRRSRSARVHGESR